ncbi:hypothetical protein EHV23_11650 [Lautropia dentalis]|uniref:Uncharacterized protein n=1 Tax=Lautropia dentalis TaxID=2490857 RepID=A0A426FMY3_9BURK|nr:hypothetical protein EHV23_11650 [Lautropia dentalis]
MRDGRNRAAQGTGHRAQGTGHRAQGTRAQGHKGTRAQGSRTQQRTEQQDRQGIGLAGDGDRYTAH